MHSRLISDASLLPQRPCSCLPDWSYGQVSRTALPEQRTSDRSSRQCASDATRWGHWSIEEKAVPISRRLIAVRGCGDLQHGSEAQLLPWQLLLPLASSIRIVDRMHV